MVDFLCSFLSFFLKSHSSPSLPNLKNDQKNKNDQTNDQLSSSKSTTTTNNEEEIDENMRWLEELNQHLSKFTNEMKQQDEKEEMVEEEMVDGEMKNHEEKERKKKSSSSCDCELYKIEIEFISNIENGMVILSNHQPSHQPSHNQPSHDQRNEDDEIVVSEMISHHLPSLFPTTLSPTISTIFDLKFKLLRQIMRW